MATIASTLERGCQLSRRLPTKPQPPVTRTVLISPRLSFKAELTRTRIMQASRIKLPWITRLRISSR